MLRGLPCRFAVDAVGRTSDENSFHFCSYRVRLLRAVYSLYAIRPIELVFSRPQSQS